MTISSSIRRQPRVRRPIAGAATALLLLLCGGIAALAADANLPPEECLRILREARIARMNRDSGGELAGLQAAWKAFPGEMAVASELLDRHQQEALPEDLYLEVITALRQRLADTSQPLPYGVLERTVQDPNTADEVLSLLLEQLEPRILGTEDGAKEGAVEPALLRLIARLQLSLQQEEEGLATLERLWRRESSEQLRWTLVRLNVKLERWPRVLELMEGQAHDASPYLQNLYIEALSKAGSFEDVMRFADGLLADPSKGYRVEVVRDAAWNLRDRRMDAEAESLFRRILAALPDDTESRAVLLHLYGSQEERQAHADALAEKWQEEANPQDLFEEGTQRLTSGDIEGAFDLLQRAAPHFPDLEAAWYNFGMAAYRLERWDAVADAFSNASRLNEGRVESFLYLGIALQKLNRCPEAVAALERVVHLDPAQTNAHYYLATCFESLGDATAARRHLEAYRATREKS